MAVELHGNPNWILGTRYYLQKSYYKFNPLHFEQ